MQAIRRRACAIGLLLAVAIAPGHVPAAWGQADGNGAAGPLPGGASSLQETYDDWQVNCRAVSGAKDCSMIQTQTRQDGQRVLAVELQMKSGGGASGILILPFGLGLDAGAALALDDGPPSAAARFSTCLPAGCVVPLAFDAKMVAALRSAKTVRVLTRRTDDQEFLLAISLKGFAAALARLGELGR